MTHPRTYKTEAIVLKRKNFSEADKILTLFSKYYGKISAIAKGIRKITSRKAGSLELFNHATVFLARGKELDIITETSLINSFSEFRKDLNKVRLAYEACEVVDKLTAERQSNDLVFLKLKDFLYLLNRHPGPRKCGVEGSSLPAGQAGAHARPRIRRVRTDMPRIFLDSANAPLEMTKIFKTQILELLGFGSPASRQGLAQDLNNESIDSYIENIIEKKLMTKKILKQED